MCLFLQGHIGGQSSTKTARHEVEPIGPDVNSVLNFGKYFVIGICHLGLFMLLSGLVLSQSFFK